LSDDERLVLSTEISHDGGIRVNVDPDIYFKGILLEDDRYLDDSSITNGAIVDG
jgi:hypothetical protein